MNDMMVSDLEQLRTANLKRQREWDPENKITALFRAVELAGEIGEACNVVKKLERDRMGLRGSRSNLDKLGEELADGIICIDLVACMYNIPLWNAVTRKFNSTSVERGLGVFL